jgi:hypothetical protein
MNGYYKGAPEVRIKHMDEKFITRYQLDCPGGKKIVGRLEGEVKSEEISSEVFVEGRYKLNVWLEDVKGQVIAGTEQTKEIKIDGNAPTLTMQFKTGSDQGNKGQTTENLVEIKGEDKLNAEENLQKKARAIRYCELANIYCEQHGLKYWKYLYIPSKQVQTNSSFTMLAQRFEAKE